MPHTSACIQPLHRALLTQKKTVARPNPRRRRRRLRRGQRPLSAHRKTLQQHRARGATPRSRLISRGRRRDRVSKSGEISGCSSRQQQQQQQQRRRQQRQQRKAAAVATAAVPIPVSAAISAATVEVTVAAAAAASVPCACVHYVAKSSLALHLNPTIPQ